MYQDLENYGYFGDGVDTGNLDPFELLLKADGDTNTEDLGVALLCILRTAIDNGTQEYAVSAYRKDLREVLLTGVLNDHPTIFFAALSFFESESRFDHDLRRVYHEIVKPRIRAGRQE